MRNIAIHIENISKAYHIDFSMGNVTSRTLQEDLINIIKKPINAAEINLLSKKCGH